MDDNQNISDFYGYSVASEKNGVSEYRYGIWQFIDPESLNWVDNGDGRYVATHDTTLGIVLSNMKYPNQIVERIEAGQKIVRDSTYKGLLRYYKLPENETQP